MLNVRTSRSMSHVLASLLMLALSTGLFRATPVFASPILLNHFVVQDIEGMQMMRDESSPSKHTIKTVFIILMENHNWSDIKGNSYAPYINNTLLPMASYTQQYYNPPNSHPSEPNYLWLEAGSNLGVVDDNPPS